MAKSTTPRLCTATQIPSGQVRATDLETVRQRLFLTKFKQPIKLKSERVYFPSVLINKKMYDCIGHGQRSMIRWIEWY